jgi:hypothetical protein
VRPKSEWKKIFVDALNGVERELCPSSPKRVRVAIADFRILLDSVSSIRARERFERDIETFLESESYLRAATRRYMTKSIIKACNGVVRVMNRAKRVLGQGNK